MVASNPRQQTIWTPRTQEMTHGFNPREILDHDINPNEDSDGLSHHGMQTPEDQASREQQDSKKRRDKALAELLPKFPHISIRPEKIDDTLGRSPQMENEQRVLESGTGLDLNRKGIGISNGANVGSVRSEGPNIKYGGSNTLVPAMLGKAIKDNRCTNCGRMVLMEDHPSKNCMFCMNAVEDSPQGFGDTSNVPYFTASEDPFESSWDSVIKERRLGIMGSSQGKTMPIDYDNIRSVSIPEKFPAGLDQCAICKDPTYAIVRYTSPTKAKEQLHPFCERCYDNYSDDVPEALRKTNEILMKARRKYKGRRYSDDEESEEEERKAKKSNKRKKRRTHKKGKTARGGRQPKSASKKRAASAALAIDRESRHQAFHPNVRSQALRQIGASRNDSIPLRLRDPVAWERKKAYERMRRQMGSMPRGLTHHADTRSVGTKLSPRIGAGGSGSSGTKLPTVSRMGTSTSRMSRDAVGDPLGAHDPLLAKSKGLSSFSRSEIMRLKKKIESMLERLNKLTKTSPELDSSAKVGAPVGGLESSAPTGGTKTNEEEKAFRFVDMQLANEMGLVGKK